MAVYTPTDRRFRRAHLKPARRRRVRARRRQLVRVAVLLLVVSTGAYWLVSGMRSATFFRIKTIAVEGNARLSTGEVRALVEALRGQSILLADLEAERARLLTSGLVKEATLRRVLPSTIEIIVTEREPVGLGRFHRRLYLVDADGSIIAEHGPRFADFDLPIIDGLSSGDADGQLIIDPARARLAARLLADVASRHQIAERISQVDVQNPYDAVVLLSGDPALIHLGNERFVGRLQAYLELAPALRAWVPEIDYVDLRFDRRVYVRPVGHAEGTTRSSAMHDAGVN